MALFQPMPACPKLLSVLVTHLYAVCNRHSGKADYRIREARCLDVIQLVGNVSAVKLRPPARAPQACSKIEQRALFEQEERILAEVGIRGGPIADSGSGKAAERTHWEPVFPVCRGLPLWRVGKAFTHKSRQLSIGVDRQRRIRFDFRVHVAYRGGHSETLRRLPRKIALPAENAGLRYRHRARQGTEHRV